MTTLPALTGAMLIGGTPIHGRSVHGADPGLHAVDPSTGEPLQPAYPRASEADIREACRLAGEAFGTYRATSPEQRAVFLETIADGIEGLGDSLVERAHRESGLPVARLVGERARTTGQLRMFAALLRDGGWNDVRVSPGTAAGRPDLRRRRIALGPVAVFGASNFPLAFSVAGGDTAAALAGGCPVVVKAHEAHPGTAELVGRMIVAAVLSCALPAGTFGLLHGDAPAVGQSLVQDPRIRAVGFTGSRTAGLALVAAAAARPDPIPVHAEMSSVNPVFLLPGALAGRAEQITEGFLASLTLGAGQFCTNPGILVAVRGPGLDAFLAAAASGVRAASSAPMLTARIAAGYADGVAALEAEPGVELVARAPEAPAGASRPALFATDAERFLSTARLGQEVFGPAALIVKCQHTDELKSVAAQLDGQLTATVHNAEEDLPLAAELLPVLEQKAGRIVFNGWPTGVEVDPAMVHGGPFPATSDARASSVGTLAIDRFLRPVAYQDLPAALRPAELV